MVIEEVSRAEQEQYKIRIASQCQQFLAEGDLPHPAMPQKPTAGKQLTSRMQQESASSGSSGLGREQESGRETFLRPLRHQEVFWG